MERFGIRHTLCYLVSVSEMMKVNTVERKESTMEKKAIAYTSNIVLGNTGMVIPSALEKARIEEYAKENGIKIVAWFEEEGCEENLMARPKLKEALAYNEPYELVLMERVWAISRRWREVRRVIERFEAKKAKVECVTRLWDCVSMMARHYNRLGWRNVVCALEGEPRSINLVETYGREARNTRALVWAAEGKASVRRPAHLAFEKAA
jgi:hypothetical protein